MKEREKKKKSRLKMEKGDSWNSFSENYLQERVVFRNFFDMANKFSKTRTGN